ncbi:MAG: hypothetical protein K6C99_01500 [Lachnospiraceae bacterium]|nr:hypothetical protein [Lachnospiraceae bacterium]
MGSGDEAALEEDLGTEEAAEAAPDADLGAAFELETGTESVAEIDASPEAEIESAPEVEIESAPEASPEASFDAAELSELDAAPDVSPEASFDAAELSELDAAFGDETAQEADADPVESEIDTDDLPNANMESADSVDSDVEGAGQNDALETPDMADLSDASDMDELASMDLDDIEARMAEAEAAGDEEIQIPGADGDITDILGAMEGLDPGLADVKEVLDKSDQNIAVDAGLFDEPDIPDPLAALEDEAESDAEADASTKSGKKGKKEKKKKGGFFSKLFKKKKKDVGKDGQNEENFPDEDELDLASKLDPDDFVHEDIADRPREESDEAVAAMFSGLDSIFSDGGNGAQTPEGGSEGDIPSVDESSFGEAAMGEPSIGASSSDDAVSEEPDAEDKPNKSGGSGGGSSSADEGADGEDKGKKKKPKRDNIFKRIFAALLEDPDEDLGAVPEEQETKLSEENKQILNELDGEEENPKKEKKKKQPKEKKEKKPKVKKPKKEKEKKPEEPGVKIPKKYKIRTFMVAASVLAAILVLTVLVPSANVMSSARAAYYDKNYKDAFLSMYGKDLNESDKLIYDRSKTIILLDRKYESYTQYKAMGMRDKALDSLLQGLVRYDALKDTATELDVIDTLDATKDNILAALWDEYQISEEEAAEILKYSPADYTGKIKASAEMLPYTTIEEQVSSLYGYPENTDNGGSVEPAVPDDAGNDNGEEELYPDLLPEEQEHIESNNNAENPDIPEDTPDDTDQRRREGYGEKEDGTNVPVEIESEQF